MGMIVGMIYLIVGPVIGTWLGHVMSHKFKRKSQHKEGDIIIADLGGVLICFLGMACGIMGFILMTVSLWKAMGLE